jgi:hypothetical protein
MHQLQPRNFIRNRRSALRTLACARCERVGGSDFDFTD